MIIRPLSNTRNLVITYTLLFGILVAGIFAIFILQHKTFVNTSDAYDQGYFWTVEMKKNLQALVAGDGYPMWSWARGTGMDLKPPIDPFLVIAALFPVGYVEFGYTIAILLRLYFAGIAFIAFAGEVGLDNFRRLIGAISYVFASWTLDVALVQGQFIDMLILFPLLVMGVDRVYKGKTPALFIIAVGFSVAINYYLAFMAAIAIILYIILRYFAYNEKFNILTYIKSIGLFIVYGIVGIMTAAFFVLVTIKTLMGASTGSGAETVPFFSDMDFLINYPLKLLSQGYHFGYGDIGIPILALILLPLGLKKLSIRNTYVLMAAILFILSLMPIASSVMNGFGYVTQRWYFTFIFFMIWTAMECLDLEELRKTSNLVIMAIWWLVLVFFVPGLAYLDIIGSFDGKGAAIFVCGNLAVGLLLILIIALGKKDRIPLRGREGLIVAITVVTLVVGWGCSIYDDTGKFCRNNEINSQLEHSTQRAGAMIDGEGFYRIDQVDGINIHHNAGQPANENLWWGTNTLYSYDSKTPVALFELNKLVGNNYGYSKRVYVQSNGNRMGLDYLYGVRYFLGNDTKNGIDDADGYAGYGFSYKEDLDGVHVFENKYKSGLGLTYDRFIPTSEFEKLSRLQCEQAILQAAVFDDKDCAKLKSGKKITAEQVETSITDIPYEIIEMDGVTFDGNSFVAEKDEASFKLSFTGIEKSQVVVSFDNLQRLDENGNPIGNFYITCTNNKKSAAANNYENNQTLEGIVDYDFNLGYYDSYNGMPKIKLTKAGRYTFDRLYVSAMDASNYDKYASEREAGRYNVTEYDADSVTGTVDAKEDGYLFISMPIHENWDVFVDGKETEKIEPCNIAFFAVEMPEGTHEVELKYNYDNRLLGLIISSAGIILAIIICLICWRRRKRIHAEDTKD